MPYNKSIMRRFWLVSLFALICVASPLPMQAQESPTLFRSIIPQEGTCTCPNSAPDWGCILQTVQGVINLVVGLAFVLLVLSLMYAGFLLMTRGASPEARTSARRVVANTLIGLAVVLIAWLGVDFLMKTVYNPRAVAAGDVAFGPWNEIWVAGPEDMCLEVREPGKLTRGQIAARILELQRAADAGLLQGGSGVCSPTELKRAAAEGGLTMSDRNAAVIACFAGPESTCGTDHSNYCWDQPTSSMCPRGPSTAWGPYQITIVGHREMFEIPVCRRAAGVPENVPLNCGAGFSRGRPLNTAEGRQIVARCQRAASNFACSAVVANRIMETEGVGAWSGNHDSVAAHQRCAVRGR